VYISKIMLCTYQKKLYVYVKTSPTYISKRAQNTNQKESYTQTKQALCRNKKEPDLHVKNRPVYISKEPYVKIKKEPYIYIKKSPIYITNRAQDTFPTNPV